MVVEVVRMVWYGMVLCMCIVVLWLCMGVTYQGGEYVEENSR